MVVPLKLDSRFIQDVNILDGTIVAPLTPFTKIWRMRNSEIEVDSLSIYVYICIFLASIHLCIPLSAFCFCPLLGSSPKRKEQVVGITWVIYIVLNGGQL